MRGPFGLLLQQVPRAFELILLLFSSSSGGQGTHYLGPTNSTQTNTHTREGGGGQKYPEKET